MTKICVSIVEQDVERAVDSARRAAEQGADLIEVRFDLMDHLPDALSTFKELKIPKIATLRSDAEGGGFSGGDQAKQDFYSSALRSGVEMVDLELSSPLMGRRDRELRRAGVICSYHDFKGTPSAVKILDILINASAKETLPKGAFEVRSCQDLLSIAEAARMFTATEKEFVLIGMGERGMLTRVCADRLGCAFTFASLEKGKEAAQGQLDLACMRRLSSNKVVVGIVGDPVGHSLSPSMHNASFLEADVPGIYLKFHVPESELEDFFQVALDYGLRGFNVTIPHKEAISSLLDKRAPSATQVGAVNTVLIEDGEFIGHNTDVFGVEMTFNENGIDPKGKNVLLLGAGGAARACCAYLSGSGAKVGVYNRSRARAEELSRSFRNCQAIDLGANPERYDIVINSTPLGMKGFPNDLPVPEDVLARGQFVLDLVYNPPTTPLLEAAARAGASIANGECMLVHQAMKAFEIWTGRNPSKGTMLSALRGGLA
ncbi:MAG: shikimate dehydrogenase [Methanomassiliicoccales archaeon]|nr:shikimate dehydrogenase [Methanomassiliicoccales archaeon]